MPDHLAVEEDDAETETEEEPQHLQANGHSPIKLAALDVSKDLEQRLLARGKLLLRAYQLQKQQQHQHQHQHQHQPVPRSPSSPSVSNAKNGTSNAITSIQSLHHALQLSKAQTKQLMDACLMAANDPLAPSDADTAGNDHGITSWQQFLNLQQQNGQLLDALERQSIKLLEFGGGASNSLASSHALLTSLRQSLMHLVHQKRQLETQSLQQMQQLGPPVRLPLSNNGEHPWLSQPQIQQLVQQQTAQLKEELDESNAFVADLKVKVNAYKNQIAVITSKSSSTPTATAARTATAATPTAAQKAAGHGSDPLQTRPSPPGVPNAAVATELARLQTQLQEKDELLQALRVNLDQVVQKQFQLEQQYTTKCQHNERLESEKARIEKSLSDKRTLFQRAFAVKTKQLDQFCRDIALPSNYEQWTDENGIIFFRRNDCASGPELEDPRVTIALVQQGMVVNATGTAGAIPNGASVATGSKASPKSASGRIQTVDARLHLDSLVLDEDVIPLDLEEKQTVDDFQTPLPDGWQMRVMTNGSVFFVNPKLKITTWKDPRQDETKALAAGDSVDPMQQICNNSDRNPHKPVQHNASKTKSGSPIQQRRGPEGRQLLTIDTQLVKEEQEQAHDGPQDSSPEEEAKEEEEDPRPDQMDQAVQDPGLDTQMQEEQQQDQDEHESHLFDVVFEDKGPIGIHFQANYPDEGATVRRVVAGTAASEKGILKPYDRLVFVNKNSVTEAPFRHIMLLLKGGLRPLTLTFERQQQEASGPRRPRKSSRAQSSSSSSSSTTSSHDRDRHGYGRGGKRESEIDLDEEIAFDDDEEHLRDGGIKASRPASKSLPDHVMLVSPRSQRPGSASWSGSSSSTGASNAVAPVQEEDYTFADRIITGLFSLFWEPPEAVTEDNSVQVV